MCADRSKWVRTRAIACVDGDRVLHHAVSFLLLSLCDVPRHALASAVYTMRPRRRPFQRSVNVALPRWPTAVQSCPDTHDTASRPMV